MEQKECDLWEEEQMSSVTTITRIQSPHMQNFCKTAKKALCASVVQSIQPMGYQAMQDQIGRDNVGELCCFNFMTLGALECR